MPTCAICLAEVGDDIAPLDGCIHRYHPECIIPYFRTSTSNGRCPECRRNPFETNNNINDELEPEAEDDELEPEDDDVDWNALKRIRELQTKTAKESRDPTIKNKLQKMNSRIKAAREARQQAVRIQKKFKASREYSKMQADLARHKRNVKESRSQVKKLSKEIDKKSRVKSFVKKAKRSIDNSKSSLGSQVDPLWRYEIEPDNWSEQLSSNAIRRLYKQGIVTDDTHIWHPEFVRSIPYKRLKHDFRYKYI